MNLQIKNYEGIKMSTVYVERGRIIKTKPEIVLCLWENWDIFDSILDGKYNAKKIENGIFSGKILVVSKDRLKFSSE
jgi:hypothetical protein